MKRRILLAIVAVLFLAAAAFEVWVKLADDTAGRQPGQPVPASGPVIYYQDPDGKPVYAPLPRKTMDGRDFRAVLASEDVSFDPAPPPPRDTARKIKLYRNPMGLPDTSPVPKKDSMGMDYIPVYEDEGDDDTSFKLSPGRLQRTGVTTEPAAMRTISPTIRAPGVVQLDERRVSVVSMRMETWIQKIEDVTTGSRVRKGQPLMEVYSPAFASAAAEYVAILGSSSIGKEPTINRGARQRLLNLAVPPDIIESIEKKAEVPINVLWRAPRDGIVLERNATEGMRAEPGAVLFRLADTSVVWAMIDVAERDYANLKVDQPVTIRTKALANREFKGVIKVINPQIAKDTRTVRVRVEIDNTDLALLPDMYVEAQVQTGRTSAVTVPDSAVIENDTERFVFIDQGEGVMQKRVVTVGARGGGFVEITDGVADGEAVVTSANFLLDAESNLRAAVRGYSAAGGGK